MAGFEKSFKCFIVGLLFKFSFLSKTDLRNGALLFQISPIKWTSSFGWQIVTGPIVQGGFGVKAGVLPVASLLVTPSSLTPYTPLDIVLQSPSSIPGAYVQVMQYDQNSWGDPALNVSNILELRPE